MNPYKSCKQTEEVISKISVMVGLFEDAIKEIIRSGNDQIDVFPGLSETIFYEKSSELIDQHSAEDF